MFNSLQWVSGTNNASLISSAFQSMELIVADLLNSLPLTQALACMKVRHMIVEGEGECGNESA